MPLSDYKHCKLGLTRWFYDHLVPKDPFQNIEFRKWILEKCWADPEIAREVWIICARDFLFYVNVFGWLLEPRDKAPWQPSRCFGHAKEIPFLTRKYQDEALLEMQKNLGSSDMLAIKSREMGATWMALYLFDHAWRFHAHNHFGVVSKDEDSVDNPDDPDSLLAKLDFIHEHLPEFLQPARNRNTSKHTISNMDNGSSITGYACTGNMARGGRKRAFLCDEVHSWPAIVDSAAFDSLQHVTHCRMMISTPNRDRGQAGAFYDACEKPDANIIKFEWSWMLDEDKAAGLYRSDGNTIEYLDPSYVYPANYKFIRDGQTRSPYFDYECSRAGATEQSIAAELGMNFGGATSRFFNPGVIFKALHMTRDPNARFEVRKEHGEWLPELIVTERDNPIDLWITYESGLRISDRGVLLVQHGRMYSMGVDIAAGKGGSHSSCSAVCVIDTRLGVQVAEYAFNKIEPEDFAGLCAQIGSVFNKALMFIEVTGVGQRFLGKILTMHYPNLWFRPPSRDDIRQGITTKVGYDNKDGGQAILGELQQAIQRDKFQPRSKRAIAECERYYLDKNGNLKHPLVGAGRADAPEKSHGDCAIAMAGAWFAIHTESQYRSPEPAASDAPYGSALWRREQRSGKQGLNPRFWDPLEAQPV